MLHPISGNPEIGWNYIANLLVNYSQCFRNKCIPASLLEPDAFLAAAG